MWEIKFNWLSLTRIQLTFTSDVKKNQVHARTHVQRQAHLVEFDLRLTKNTVCNLKTNPRAHAQNQTQFFEFDLS